MILNKLLTMPDVKPEENCMIIFYNRNDIEEMLDTRIPDPQWEEMVRRFENSEDLNSVYEAIQTIAEGVMNEV